MICATSVSVPWKLFTNSTPANSGCACLKAACISGNTWVSDAAAKTLHLEAAPVGVVATEELVVSADAVVEGCPLPGTVVADPHPPSAARARTSTTTRLQPRRLAVVPSLLIDSHPSVICEQVYRPAQNERKWSAYRAPSYYAHLSGIRLGRAVRPASARGASSFGGR